VGAVTARRPRTRRGRRPLACAKTLCAEPGRPCTWPGDVLPGPHGEPEGHDRDGRVQGVGQLHSTDEAFEQGSPHGTGGEGGGKGAGQGERGGGNQEPDTVPGPPVTGALPRTAGTFGCLDVRPEAGARCGSAARRDLCGGCRVTGIPTATCARHGAQRHDGAGNRKAKANREVTRGCKSLGGLDDRNS
jgi:hypothetical protein